MIHALPSLTDAHNDDYLVIALVTRCGSTLKNCMSSSQSVIWGFHQKESKTRVRNRAPMLPMQKEQVWSTFVADS